MEELLEAYSELFRWVLEKSYGWAMILLLVLVAVITALITAFIFQKIIVPARTIKTVELERDNEELTKQLQELKEEHADLTMKLQDFKLDQAIKDSVDEPDPFLKQ